MSDYTKEAQDIVNTADSFLSKEDPRNAVASTLKQKSDALRRMLALYEDLESKISLLQEQHDSLLKIVESLNAEKESLDHVYGEITNIQNFEKQFSQLFSSNYIRKMIFSNGEWFVHREAGDPTQDKVLLKAVKKTLAKLEKKTYPSRRSSRSR